MSYSLICEGRCNPSITVVDAVVADIRREEDRFSRVAIVGTGRHQRSIEALTKLYGRLVYTVHESSGPQTVRCQICGNERRYGS